MMQFCNAIVNDILYRMTQRLFLFSLLSFSSLSFSSFFCFFLSFFIFTHSSLHYTFIYFIFSSSFPLYFFCLQRVEPIVPHNTRCVPVLLLIRYRHFMDDDAQQSRPLQLIPTKQVQQQRLLRGFGKYVLVPHTYVRLSRRISLGIFCRRRNVLFF